MGSSLLTYLRRFVAFAWFALLVALLGLAALSHAAPHIGHTLMIIRGASMEPAIPLGSLVATRPVDPGDVRVGDVVTVRAKNGALITHRVVSITDSGGASHLRLHGDANHTPDADPVAAGSVVGRVAWSVPVAGYLLFLLTLPTGVLACMSLLGSLLLMYWLLEDIERDALASARRRLLAQRPSPGVP
jgi:signal peptidase I